MATRQQLEAQLVAAHRSGNVAAAQQAAYAIRAFDQNSLMAQVPTVNAPAVNRPVQPRWDDMLTQFSQGLGSGIKSQLQGVEQIVTQPVESAKALYQAGVEAFRDPAKALGEAWSGIRSTAERAVSSPMGFGQVLGENVNIVRVPGGRRQPTQAELDVYHGTPHTFEPEEGAPLGRFRSSKIGTGEGVQAHGYGLYFSESPSVAKTYQGSVSAIHKSGVPTIEGKPINWDDPRQTAAFELSRHNGDRAAAADFHARMFLGGEDNPAVKLLRSGEPLPTVDMPGRLYQVDLPDAKIEQMMDWDKPLSQQPKALQDAVAKLPRFQDPYVVSKTTGGEAYRELAGSLGSTAKASDLLRQLGIPGVKYLDAGSRDGGKGTRNFVVFPGEEQNLTILERDGVKAEVPKAAAPKPAASTPRVATWFSGGGTVESALPTHERVMAAEYNPQINAAANKALGTSFPTRDVNKIDPQELKAANPDLFHASPVCKNFSAAKTMRGATELDRESANSVANAIRVATPPVVTIENVPQYADTALFRHITDALDEKGYKWDVVIHDAADYGAPQSRKRMLLRAVREGELPPLPPKTGGKDWFGAVSDLLPDAPDSIIPPVERRRLDDMIAAGKLDPSKPIITMGGSGFKGTWSAANAGQVAPTLKAANEKPRVIMPDGTVKTVTGRMMARLMGLGDDVPVPDSPTLAKTVLGNGISGDVTRALIAPLLNRNP